MSAPSVRTVTKRADLPCTYKGLHRRVVYRHPPLHSALNLCFRGLFFHECSKDLMTIIVSLARVMLRGFSLINLQVEKAGKGAAQPPLSSPLMFQRMK